MTKFIIPCSDADAERLTCKMFSLGGLNYDDDMECVYDGDWKVTGIQLNTVNARDWVVKELIGNWVATDL